jgi:hypothetical protein
MTKRGSIASNKLVRRVAPVLFVTLLGIGAAACGSSGGNGGSGGSHSTSTPAPAKSGGAGF